MVGYMKNHEKFVMEFLESNKKEGLLQIKEYHKVQIEVIQHERLVHLLVTLAFGCFFLISVLFAAVFEKLGILALSFLFLVLLVPYIIHYYKLENGIQRWYGLYNDINKRLDNKFDQ
jgi:cell division protein FtsW (lipid II flippase)